MAMTANRSMLGDGVVNCGGRVVFLLPLSRLVSGNLPCHEVVADCSKLWWMIAVLETLWYFFLDLSWTPKSQDRSTRLVLRNELLAPGSVLATEGLRGSRFRRFGGKMCYLSGPSMGLVDCCPGHSDWSQKITHWSMAEISLSLSQAQYFQKDTRPCLVLFL